MPEDLLAILCSLNFLIPSGSLSASLSLNFGIDIFDGILTLLNQFMPFLMMYKFFLPILNIIICIIEVLCSLVSPFALIGALDRLFTQCIPAFLNLFPIFALIIMIISILLLILALIEYILSMVFKLTLSLQGNIIGLISAFEISNTVGILAIASKLGDLLCVFQNLLVLLAFFDIIIQAIKDILALGFSIPPCEGGDNSNCCGPNTCPVIVQAPYTNTTGELQYANEVGIISTIAALTGFYNIDLRSESWQLYDPNQTIAQQFWNVVEAYDVIADGYNPPPIYFPTTQLFTAYTPPKQAAYTVDLKLDYDPIQWGRLGNKQTIIFRDCIVLFVPTQTLQGFDNTPATAQTVTNGVIYIAGGFGYLKDGKTKLKGYAADGITPIADQATLGNFLHKTATFAAPPGSLSSSGTLALSTIESTFKPNMPALLQANLVTLGCMPSIALNKAFVNNVVFSNIRSEEH